MKGYSRNQLPQISFKDGARTAAANGDNIIDLQGFEGATVIIASGTITDGTLYTFELKHGDAANLSDAAAVPDTDLVPGGHAAGDLEPAFAAADDDHIHWFGYVGIKRYLRIDLAIVTGSPSTGGHFLGVVVKFFPRHAPTV
jgi:hypothetical protein